MFGVWTHYANVKQSTTALTAIHMCTVAINIHKSSIMEPKREPAANINSHLLPSSEAFIPGLNPERRMRTSIVVSTKEAGRRWRGEQSILKNTPTVMSSHVSWCHEAFNLWQFQGCVWDVRGSSVWVCGGENDSLGRKANRIKSEAERVLDSLHQRAPTSAAQSCAHLHKLIWIFINKQAKYTMNIYF